MRDIIALLQIFLNIRFEVAIRNTLQKVTLLVRRLAQFFHICVCFALATLFQQKSAY
jgi:hypothetical protein